MDDLVAWIIPCGLRVGVYRFFAKYVWRDDRPKAMRRQGRVIVERFTSSEWLYFRWFSDWFETEGQLRSSQVPIPDQSVNRRGCGGRCWFVLVPEPACNVERVHRQLGQGIVAIKVSDIPEEFMDGEQRYSFLVQHDPEDHNYQHCEIRVFGQRGRLDKSTIAKAVKLYYRFEIAKAARLLLRPEVATGRSKPATR